VTEVRVALCGCGNMGSAIAERLRGRADLTVFDLDAERMAQTGARTASDLASLAKSANVVLLSLPSPRASDAVAHELVSLLPRGAVVVETSTVSPAQMQQLAGVFEQAGVQLVDAAVLSGPTQMREGRTILLVGGCDDAVATATPVLELLGGRLVRLGAIGAGMAAKVANNAVSHAVMVVLLEATAMATAAGVDAEVFADLLAGPDGGLIRPLTHRMQERIFDGDFDGGMPTEAALKDSRLALALAQDTGVPLFAVQGAHTVYELAVAAGLAREDYAAIAKLWEAWTEQTFRRRPA
jgi:3-hydroxyisobutyrate dehydrogenase-like beta-hydroxyacid dehydrogenase